jgi:hypothetical protein
MSKVSRYLTIPTAMLLLALFTTPLPLFAVGPTEFEDDLTRVLRELSDSAVFNADTCSRYLKDNTEFLIQHGANIYLPKSEQEMIHLSTVAPQILNDMFQLRLLIHDRLKTFHAGKPVNKECITGIRRTLRYSRFIEEFLSEWYVSKSEYPLPDTPFTGTSPSHFVNHEFRNYEFQTGDILLMRSDSFVSATIARIGDEDGQFSHAALIYIPEKGAAPLIIEATVQKGSYIHPLEDVFHKAPPRIMLLRHDNAEYAIKSAQEIYTYIQAEEEKRGFIPYDFNLDLDTPDVHFCTELISYAYNLGSNGRVKLPAYPTSMAAFTGHPFLQQMGISPNDTFAPSDIEIDPELTLVAEWRNIPLTGKTRQQDAILTSILDWMVNHDYQLSFHALNRLGTGIAWRLMKPAGLFVERLPTNMDRSFLGTVLLLRTITNALEKEIQKKIGNQDDIGVTVDYASIMNALESVRQEDCMRDRAYKQWRSSFPLEPEDDTTPPPAKFHHLISVPDDAGGCPIDRAR